MVVASPAPARSEKIRVIYIPVIDLSWRGGGGEGGGGSHVVEVILKACEEYGFFKVINHGVAEEVIERMEVEGRNFFALPASVKQQAGPANPLGYGCKNIGFNGDKGELEYLLFHTDPLSISQKSKTISSEPEKFCCGVNDYVEAVRDLACEILELLAEGLRIQDKRVFSRLVRDGESDSLFRLNYYPCCEEGNKLERDMSQRIGFGEHSDPQLLTLLRSNGVGGLQISPEDGVWVPVPPDPSAFCVNVGDALQALTNGRLVSVRHRAMANSCKSRMSMIYFAAPPLQARISPLSDMVSQQNPPLYRPFTWAEYKKATYARTLGDRRLQVFKAGS